MRNLNNAGVMNSLTIPLVISVVLILGLAGFGVWSYLNYTEQRDNVDEIVASAVEEAKAAQQDELSAQFEEERKSPYDSYTSPSSLGSVSITYPRTWSAYVEETDSTTSPLDGYFHPNFVPRDTNDTAFALRVTLEARDYDREVAAFNNEIEDGDVTAKPIKIEGVTGTILDGEIENNTNGSKLILPLRDRTLTLWTEAPGFVKDFKNIIVKNLTFVP